jgi:hypothetical protein
VRTAVAVVAFLLSLFSGISPAQNLLTPKSVVIFLDDLHIDFQNTPKLRTGFKQATQRLLAAGRQVAMVSDGPSDVSIRPTNDGTALSQIANRIAGAGLKPTETANPSPTVAADVKRREATAEETLQSILRSPGIDAILYVTERQMQPIAAAIPIVMTRPEGMEAAVAELFSR